MTGLLRNLLMRDHPLRWLATTVLAEVITVFGCQLPTEAEENSKKHIFRGSKAILDSTIVDPGSI